VRRGARSRRGMMSTGGFTTQLWPRKSNSVSHPSSTNQGCETACSELNGVHGSSFSPPRLGPDRSGRFPYRDRSPMGASLSSVRRWFESHADHGEAGLAPRPKPGRPRLLTPAQDKTLVRMLAQGARAPGWATDLWTTQCIADLIDQSFGVRCPPTKSSAWCAGSAGQARSPGTWPRRARTRASHRLLPSLVSVREDGMVWAPARRMIPGVFDWHFRFQSL
jgi:hypothetical protein